MIRNINYKGYVDPQITRYMGFSKWKPCQYIERSGPYTLIFFRSGQCRIMGCKTPLEPLLLKYPIRDIKLQSVTVTINLGTSVNLYKLAGNFTIIVFKNIN